MQIRPRNTNTAKRNELWQGIVRKAQADGDHSLDSVNDAKVVPMYRKLAAVGYSLAVVCVLIGGLWFYKFKAQPDFILEQELKQVFADTNSVSRLVLSNGDTIILDDKLVLDSSIQDLATGSQILDFRRLKQTELLGNIQTLETGRGKQLHAILSDGTGVWLNAASKIEFPARFEGDTRNVAVSGEVYFEVTSNKKQPFIVRADNQEIKVLGTHFNTRQYKGENFRAVTLLEGSVEVSNSDMAGKSSVLKPSQQITFQDNKSVIQTLSNPESVVAWKDGEFYFSDADAEMIVKELERWYPVVISLQQVDNSKKISGRIKRGDSMKEVVDMLRFFDIEIQVEQQK